MARWDRRRAVVALGVAVVAVTGLAGCAENAAGPAVLDGVTTTSAAPVGPAGSAPPSVSPSPGVPDRPLVSYLEPLPEGATRGSLAWAQIATPTVDQFLAEYYPPEARASEQSVLAGDGLEQIAHVLWVVDGIQADVLLLQFGTETGAVTRYDGVVAVNARDASKKPVPLTGPGSPRGFYTPAPTADGHLYSRSYSRVGSIVVEVFVYSPGTLEVGRLQTWTEQQVARLPGATSEAADG